MPTPPANIAGLRPHTLTGDSALQQEIVAEQAAALGHAGRRAEAALQRLRAEEQAGGKVAELRLREVADAVHAYFIQRETCGFMRHDAIVEEMGIPRRVLARLGAR